MAKVKDLKSYLYTGWQYEVLTSRQQTLPEIGAIFIARRYASIIFMQAAPHDSPGTLVF